MTKEELFAIMKGTVIVSCQATPGEPLYDPERSIMPYMALAAKQAGAKMIRTSSARDIAGIKEMTEKNRVDFVGPRDLLLATGFQPCQMCRP